jgi:hypothetical protein
MFQPYPVPAGSHAPGFHCYACGLPGD